MARTKGETKMNKQELLVKYKKLWDIKGDGVWWEKLIDEAIIIGKQEAISEFKEKLKEWANKRECYEGYDKYTENERKDILVIILFIII